MAEKEADAKVPTDRPTNMSGKMGRVSASNYFLAVLSILIAHSKPDARLFYIHDLCDRIYQLALSNLGSSIVNATIHKRKAPPTPKHPKPRMQRFDCWMFKTNNLSKLRQLQDTSV